MTTSNTIELLRKRRTQYALGKTLPISQEAAIQLIEDAVEACPSAFNSQTSRVVILFGAASDTVWNLTKEALRPIVPAEAFADTEAKINSFSAGAGTVLFFEDQSVVEGLQAQFAIYADYFPVWSETASGMAQLAVWTTLAEANIGASLQHYNPLIDSAIHKEWSLPEGWKLRAQMPFGSNEAPFGEKATMPRAERFKVIS